MAQDVHCSIFVSFKETVDLIGVGLNLIHLFRKDIVQEHQQDRLVLHDVFEGPVTAQVHIGPRHNLLRYKLFLFFGQGPVLFEFAHYGFVLFELFVGHHCIHRLACR